MAFAFGMWCGLKCRSAPKLDQFRFTRACAALVVERQCRGGVSGIVASHDFIDVVEMELSLQGISAEQHRAKWPLVTIFAQGVLVGESTRMS